MLKANVQISYDGFLSNFRPPPLIWRYSDVFSQPLPPYDIFNQPLPKIEQNKQ